MSFLNSLIICDILPFVRFVALAISIWFIPSRHKLAISLFFVGKLLIKASISILSSVSVLSLIHPHSFSYSDRSSHSHVLDIRRTYSLPPSTDRLPHEQVLKSCTVSLSIFWFHFSSQIIEKSQNNHPIQMDFCPPTLL